MELENLSRDRIGNNVEVVYTVYHFSSLTVLKACKKIILVQVRNLVAGQEAAVRTGHGTID